MNQVLTVGLGVIGAGVVASLPAIANEVMEMDTLESEQVQADPLESEQVQVDTLESEPTEETAEATIVDIAAGSEDFETLVAAVEAAGLTETLSGEGPFTVFAPTDEAFEALPEGALEALLLPQNQALLAQILTYHVVPGAVTSSDLTEGEVATVEGSDVTVSLGDSVMVNDAMVTTPDIEASNGVIHVIDKVIIPPSLLSELSPESEAPSL
ncbi:MAG TPA: fasciclin domain-containing protein [Trichocoleus sp.]